MKKRLVALLLAVVSLFVLTACSGGSSKLADADKQLFDKAVANQKELKSIDVNMTMKIKMEAGGQSQAMDLTSAMQVDMSDQKNPKVAQKLDMSVLGKTQAVKMYYANGYLYAESNGAKVKTKLPAEKLSDAKLDGSQTTENLTFTSDVFKKASARKDGENTVFDFTLDLSKDSEFGEKLKDLIASSAANNSSGIAIDMEVTELSGSMTITPDGYYTNQTLNMDIKMKSGAQQAKAKMDIILDYKNPGKPVVVQMPSDLSLYREVTNSALGLSNL